jgi:hypothetical protein
MGVSLPIVGPLPGHPESLPEDGLALNPRVAARPRTTSGPGHPRPPIREREHDHDEPMERHSQNSYSLRSV